MIPKVAALVYIAAFVPDQWASQVETTSPRPHTFPRPGEPERGRTLYLAA